MPANANPIAGPNAHPQLAQFPQFLQAQQQQQQQVALDVNSVLSRMSEHYATHAADLVPFNARLRFGCELLLLEHSWAPAPSSSAATAMVGAGSDAAFGAQSPPQRGASSSASHAAVAAVRLCC